MNFTKYVEEQKQLRRMQNIQILRQEIEQDWVSEKIYAYIQRFNGMFNYEQVKQEIIDNDIVASFFFKDPSKQNLSEILAVQVLNVEKLPSRGKSCIRFNDVGEIVSNAAGNTKSADFKLNDYYATQKYTNENGGAQDNQKNDVIDFLKRGSLQYKVAAVLDGAYWDIHREELKKLFANNGNVLITSVSELTGGEDDE